MKSDVQHAWWYKVAVVVGIALIAASFFASGAANAWLLYPGTVLTLVLLAVGIVERRRLYSRTDR